VKSRWHPETWREKAAANEHLHYLRLSRAQLASRVQQVARVNGMPIPAAAVAQTGHIDRPDRLINVIQ